MKKYFLFSQEYLNEKQEIAKKLGKEFVCGTVTVGSTTKNYVYLGNSPSLGLRYPDSDVVASGDPDTFYFTKPEMKARSTK